MRLLLLALATAASTASADCTPDTECAAIQRWRAAERITVEVSRSDGKSSPAKLMLQSHVGETLLSFQQDGTRGQVLMIPGIATLYSGLPPDTTCDGTGDTAVLVASMVAIPLGYLAKAIPTGPEIPSKSATNAITLPPGRMYIDPGNFVEIKRPLDIEAMVIPEADGIVRYVVSERAKSLLGAGAKTTYSGLWEKKASTVFPEDKELLNVWLVCPQAQTSLKGLSTLGQLRSMGRSN